MLSLTLSSVWLSHWYNDGVLFRMKFIIIMVWLCVWEETTRGNIFLDQQTSEIGVVQRVLLLTGPSRVTAYWVTYQWNLQQTWEWAFPALWDKMVRKCPPNHGQTHGHKGALWLETGTCHLPLQRLNHGHYSRWPSTSPEWNSGWQSEIRHSLCALKKMDKTGLQIVRYFQVKISWAQILAASHT